MPFTKSVDDKFKEFLKTAKPFIRKFNWKEYNSRLKNDEIEFFKLKLQFSIPNSGKLPRLQ